MENDFEELYLKYENSVFLYLLSLTKDKSLAEELTQETFYKALKNYSKYNPKYKMYTWLCTIAKNTYFSLIKKKKWEDINENIADSEKEVIDQIIDTETNEKLLKIVHELKEPYKEVFTLRVYGELSFKQIGLIFSKTESWARITYYRSKVQIKERLEDEKEL